MHRYWQAGMNYLEYGSNFSTNQASTGIIRCTDTGKQL